MSELRPPTPARRPDSARRREDAVPEVEPPSPAELEAIQRHLVTLPAQEGAEVSDDEELHVTLVRGPGSGPDATYAAVPRWTADDWPRSLAAVSERLRGEGRWPSLLLCDRLDRPLGLDGELRRAGWVQVTSEAVLWVGHASVVPHLDPTLRIEAVQPRAAELHERLEREIFGIAPEHADRRRAALAEGIEAGTLRAWIVWLGDDPVAVARLSRGRDALKGIAALQGVGVVESRRGQGFGTLITTIATRAGLAIGARLVWLSVQLDNDRAQRVYARLGFRPAFRWARWLDTRETGPPSGAAAGDERGTLGRSRPR